MKGERKALIVASGEYEHPELRRLPSAAADAEALRRALADPGIGEFDVQILPNLSAHTVREHIEEFFAECRPEDLLLLHFSGHGVKSDAGELFFAAHNTRPTLLRSTAIPADFVQQCMRTSRSRSIVLLLDCCYGGAFEQGVEVRAGGDVNVLDAFPNEKIGGTGGSGRAIITACGSMEYAFEGDHLGDTARQPPSLFTGVLVQGLVTGDADRDEDGWISLNELYDYVYDRVRVTNPKQTPTRKYNLQGELYLAHSRRRRIQPRPIPHDLHAALNDENRYARIGAIIELRTRLASDNLAVAAGARDALLHVKDADIEHVADVAARALRMIELHPSQTDLHFGPLIQGSSPPQHTVTLLGPPIARVCTHRTTDDRVRVTETDNGLDISIDTTHAGPLDAHVMLAAPSSEATIHIVADVTPPAPTPSPPTTDPADSAAPASVPAEAEQQPAPHVAPRPSTSTTSPPASAQPAPATGRARPPQPLVSPAPTAPPPPPGGPWSKPAPGSWGSPRPAGRKTNGLAIAAFVCSLLPLTCGPVGLIMGILAWQQVRQRNEGGKYLALAAMIIGAVSILLGFVYVILTGGKS
jgi:hypothetical protein